MNTRKDPKDLTTDLLKRSVCAVRVAAVLADPCGIHSWSVNHVGDGYGKHAEAACLRRVNLRRLQASTLYVAAERARNERMVIARPCEDCARLIAGLGVGRVLWRDRDGDWRDL